MAWYWYILIVLVSMSVGMLVFWALSRGGRKVTVDRVGLAKIEKERLEAMVEAEKEGRKKAEKALKEVAEEHKKILEWYNQKRQKIEEDARHEFENLSTDPDALDRKLDDLLGSS